MIELNKLAKNIQAEHYLVKDYNKNIIYSGDIIFNYDRYDAFIAIAEYVLFENIYFLLLHNPTMPYNITLCNTAFIEKDHNNGFRHFFKKDKNIALVKKDFSNDKYIKFQKMYKGVLQRNNWKSIPELITKNISTFTKSNFEHFKEYDKYNVYAILHKHKSNHYEFLFKGDLLNLPF